MANNQNKSSMLLGVVLTIAAVGQIILAILLYNPNANISVINAGWFVMMLSAIFGWLPILTLRRKGKVQGRSYVHTAELVDSGVYAIVRHPQYLAGVLLCIALPMISQHWLVVLPGIVAIASNVMGIPAEEEQNIKKFGEDYHTYVQKVPRLNFLLGILRLLRKSDQKNGL